MARINALSKSSLIALVSDVALATGQADRFTSFASFVETHGLDNAAPALISTLMRESAAQREQIAALTAKLAATSATVVAWDRDDMAVSAAMLADAPVGRHAVREKAAPVWALDSALVPDVARRTGLTAGQVRSLAAERNGDMLAVLPAGPAALAALIAAKAARDTATVYGVTGGFYSRIKSGVAPAEILAWLTDSKRGA